MPTLQEIIKEKVSRLNSVPDSFISSVEKDQRRIFNEIINELEQLEVVEGGKIALSNGNLALIEKIGGQLQKVIQGSEYSQSVLQFAKQFEAQKNLNIDMFSKAFGEFDAKSIYDNVYKNAKEQAITQLTDTVVTDASNQFKGILSDAISTSDTYANLIGNVKTLIEGNSQVEGKLTSYAKQNAHDLFSITDRKFTTAVAEDYGILFYEYMGGEIDTTREFCQDREGKVYHKAEIEAWAGRTWAGKAKGTTASTIFVLCGGYNCRHSLVPVRIDRVPKDVIQRNLDNGNLSPDDLPEEMRGRFGA